MESYHFMINFTWCINNSYLFMLQLIMLNIDMWVFHFNGTNGWQNGINVLKQNPHVSMEEQGISFLTKNYIFLTKISCKVIEYLLL